MYSLKHVLVNSEYVLKVMKRKPLFIIRLLRNYIKLFFNHNRPLVRFVDIAVTYKCNMKCTHCSSSVMDIPHKKTLTVEQYELIAKKLLKAGLLVVNFTGGEAFIRKDFFDIINVFQPHKFLIAVQTNASLITEDCLQNLRKIGVDSLDISIDSADPEGHDKFRHTPGAFEKCIKAIEMGKKIGFNVGISYCLTHDNLHSEDREKIVELSKKYNTLLNYVLAVPIGFWRGKYDNLLTSEDRKYLLNILEEYPQSKTDFETNYFKKGCGAIKEKLYISAYGEVMPCPFIQISFGNILTDEVEEIRNRALKYKYFQDYFPHCMAAEDMDLIKNAICYSKEASDMQMPLPHTEAFFDRSSALAKKTK